MSQFKFSVGEPVILQCLDYPHLNGEYTVTHCIHAHEVYPDPEFGQALRPEILGYFLDGARLILQDGDGNPATALWFEGALRKKYQPGELSFKELLQGIGSPEQQKAKEAEPCA
ncbi:hypothetical protein ACKUFS_11450 [Pseudomonas cannabina]|uniref:Uncharacterized protein n=1 Tax=Pseudomonas cannabina pv. alisalensis TaxID=757414 RepID=A0ABS1XFA8_PSEC1|nr:MULTISPECIES: hypothetical protein [Pseudomonas syringae group]KPB77952.1 Uncharacterized protein AC507_1661 [Pseudomonas syringae pv. maculicola]MBM0140186.1 hypothetical protein [Pseudomonas cannabina pv. alisalensis]QQN20103.1 hypothetical protein JGS08_15820 [Pseudomonas cannabina pv. alisalensis]